MQLPFPSPPDELRALKIALADEEKAERLEHADSMKNLSLQQKRAAGLAISPLKYMESGIFRGERWRLRFEHNQATLRISEGSPIRLIRDDNVADGIAVRIGRNFIEVVVNAYPDWIEEGKPWIEADFPDLVWREMGRALDQMIDAEEQKGEKGKRARLRSALLGYEGLLSERLVTPQMTHPAYESLNESQQEAIRGILTTPDLAVIHGPPGTGKTTVLVAAVTALNQTGETLLICAPTNAAVDLIALRLQELGNVVLRIGHPARVHEDAQKLTIDGRMEERSESKLLAKYRIEAVQLFKKARRYKRTFDEAARREKELLFAEYRSLQKMIRDLERTAIADIIERTSVVCTTLTGASHPMLKDKKFTTVVIDEAAQALEPACYIPLLKNPDRIVLAGDHRQLAPVTRHESSVLGTTLFEKMLERHRDSGRIFFLNEQYRMEPSILGFPNQRFYDDRLRSHGSVLARRPVTLKEGTPEVFQNPLLFIDTAGTDAAEEYEGDSQSAFNILEARLLVAVLAELYRLSDDKPSSIGLIAPYRAQVERLLEIMAADVPIDMEPRPDIDTVDSFQGAERDWIGLTFTRSNDNGEIGFLRDLRRTNVAMTRARRRLVLVGDSSTLSSHPFYAGLIEYAQSRNSYFSVWEPAFSALIEL